MDAFKGKSLEGEEQQQPAAALHYLTHSALTPPTYLLQRGESPNHLLAVLNTRSPEQIPRIIPRTAEGVETLRFDLLAPRVFLCSLHSSLLFPVVAEVMLEDTALQWPGDLLQAME
ncbi:hypothetical protein GUJ93_ZPchr0003g17630 [Zizania palustris]|uniref:Uncharacterized protein n=1 Tax=Zizania palustris TaxID=103762 RepID=A0A8J5STV5_ZIZPA|nr:hypothetical protein GUJ93_ZPchr0003g17630 [Zizania palustris]